MHSEEDLNLAKSQAETDLGTTKETLDESKDEQTLRSKKLERDGKRRDRKRVRINED